MLSKVTIVYFAQVYKSRKRGRPSIRWLDDVLEDLRRMDARGYNKMAMDRRLWRRFVLEARTVAVSYTHLDVYKRQLLVLLAA